MKEDKILITGGTGFVGKHLQEELAAKGIEYVAFSQREFDLTRPENADALFESHSDATVILHLACYQAAAEFPAMHPAEQVNINSRIHLNVLEAWRKVLPGAKMLAVGSSCAYPGGTNPLKESMLMDGAIHGSVYAYAFTKRLLYTGLKAYGDQYGLDGSFLIPSTMFGEYDDFHVDTAHVCGALVGKYVRAVREGLPEVEVWGDGTAVREFMYVKEFVAALLHLVPLCHSDLVNVGPGVGISIRQLAETISAASGFTGRTRFDAERYVGVGEKYMDASRLRDEYGWQIDPDIRPGIESTVRWYMQHYEELKDRPKFTS